MTRYKLKFLATIVMTIIVSLLACITAFANWEDETDVYWQYNWDGGNVFCRWEKCDTAVGYLINVYKMSDNGSKSKVLENSESIGVSKDVTQTLIKKGAGNYSFTVEPYSLKYSEYDERKKKHVDKYVIVGILQSGDEFFSEAEIAKIKVGRANVASAENTVSDGWHKFPDNNWTYGKGNNTLARNEWLDINGKRYHFDSKGYMNKGWQQINGNYYYFDKTDGWLYTNCQTPDGYYVNADGARVDETGTAMKGSALNATITITLEESGQDGKIKNCTLKSVSNANLVDWAFEVPYENWSAGTPVRLFVRVTSGNGFPFTKNTKFACSQATYKSFYGNDPATIELLYYPKLKLVAPSNIVLKDGNILTWRGSEYAQSYNVNIYHGGEGSPKKLKVTTTQVDISEYLDEYSDVVIGITASHNKTSGNSGMRAYYLDSDETKFYNVDEVMVDKKLTEGTFSGSTGRMTYTDADGNRVTGWQQIGGSWYCFGSDGYAKGPGWYQDKDGNWYYFDNQNVMVIGKVFDNGKEYYMNDGSNPEFPYGAWVH